MKKVSEIVDWVGLDFKATRARYRDLTGLDVAYDRMLESLKYWVSTGRGLEVRTTCDPCFVSKDDLIEIAKICAEMGVKNFAVQKYSPYHECDCCESKTDAGAIDVHHPKTNESERAQFFTDTELKQKINSLFDKVVWRDQ